MSETDVPSFRKTKAERLEEEFFRQFPAGIQYLTLKEIWSQLRQDAEALQSGTPFSQSALLPAMRGPSHLFVENVFTGGEPVDRVAPTMPSLRFRDMLGGLAGPHMAIATSTVADEEFEKAEEPRLHAHMGEEVSIVRNGRLRAEWVTWDQEARRFRLEKFDMAGAPGRRTTWRKSRIPHRLWRLGPDAQEIGFYADALGPHAIHRAAGLDVAGYGVSIVEDEALDDETLMWRYLLAVGPRADSIRRAKGIRARNVASHAHLKDVNLSRLESSTRSPKFGEIVSLAFALDVTPSELCPDNLDKTVIKGCYVWNEKDVAAWLGKLESRYRESFGQPEAGPYPRLPFPIRWRENGFLGSLCSSPRANALVAFHLYFGHSGKKTPHARYDGAIGRFNDERAIALHDRFDGFRSSNAELAILCLDGSIQVEVQRWPEAKLFPGLASAPDAGGSKVETLVPDSLLYIRPRHAFRFLRDAKPKGEVRLLCVLSTRRGAAGFVELPSPQDIEAMLDSDRAIKRKS